MTPKQERQTLLLIIPLLALFITHIGCPLPFSELVFSSNYYFNLIVAASVFILVFVYVKYLVHLLNRYVSWQERLYQRMLVQSIAGIVVPVILIISLMHVYAWASNIPYGNVYRVHIELPLTIFLVLLIHVFYEVNTFFTDSFTEEDPSGIILLKRGKENFPLNYSDVACFFIKYGNVYAITFNNERYTTDHNLADLEKILPSTFFRLNRQLISNYKAIESYRQSSFQKLKVSLKVDAGPSTHISKTKSKPFRSWLERFVQNSSVSSD